MNKGYKFSEERKKEIAEKRRLTTLKKYGVSHISQLKDVKEKKKQTTFKNFGVECPFQSKEVKEKIKNFYQTNFGVNSQNQLNSVKEKKKQACIEKYGVDCVTKVKEFKEKSKRTSLKKYGVEHPQQNKKIREKGKKTNFEKYGVECVFSSEKIKEKIKKTNLEKYGVESPLQSKEIMKKVKKTNLEKYRAENVFQNKEIHNKVKKTMVERYGVENISQYKPIKDIKIKKQKEKFKKYLYNFLSSINLELMSNYINELKKVNFKCLICGNIFKQSWTNIQQGKRCPICFPVEIGASSYEKEIGAYLEENIKDVIFKDRQILKPKELDIYIPSKQIAIEFDGLYWHSDKWIKDKNYHLNKTEKCEKKIIQLIHIFEDEWLFKQKIVKLKLKEILGLNDKKKVDYKKFILQEIESKTKDEFLDKYHIEGQDVSTIGLGIFYNKKLISVMTCLQADEKIWNINRFCHNYNFHVHDIFRKFLEYFKENYVWKEIFTYVDRRWSKGDIYKNSGFEIEQIIEPKCWFVDGSKRVNEIDLSEDINYNKIWDCGYLKFKISKD